jgi:cytochrome c
MKKSLIAAGCLGLLLSGTQIFAQGKAGDAAKGKATFGENCAICHNDDSTEDKVGPGLKGLFKRDKLKSGKPMNEANVRDQINNGGNGMPGFGDLLTDDDRANLIAYLKSL